MLKRLFFLALVGILVASCSGAGRGDCKSWMDEAFVDQEYDEETGEVRLTLDLDEEELGDAQRPVAVFLVPDRDAARENFRLGQFWEEVDPQSELGAKALTVLVEALAAEGLPAAGACQLLDDQTLFGCEVVMATMTGMIGSCCNYALAYSASIFLSDPVGMDAEVLTAVVILSKPEDGAKECSQVVLP